MLDGWRALSILLVLAGHLLPLGPKRFRMNETIAATGMALFFTLSGFLITRFLSDHADPRSFIIRRFFRIVPLAWVAVGVAVALTPGGAAPATWAANLLFYANLPPQHLLDAASHLWSLGVEMQFYVGAAILIAIGGRRSLMLIPVFCVGVTTLRVATGAQVSIVTWLRVDEILAGGIVSLAYSGWFGSAGARFLGRINSYLLFILLVASAHPAAGALDYARPYLAAALVGGTLYRAPRLLTRIFESRAAAYVATVSYAVYIIHGVLRVTWLGSGTVVVRYLKRPLLFAATFALAHLSTFYFERRCIEIARRLSGAKRTAEPQ